MDVPNRLFLSTERLSTLDDEDRDYDLDDEFKSCCSRSLIQNGWILTAGHCYKASVNEMDAKFVIGKNDCAEDDNMITIEMA